MSKMGEAARKCEEAILRQWPDATAHSGGPEPQDVPAHMLWMCQKIPTLPRGKADRWLGFVQGWLWEMGYASISEMREWNRGLEDEYIIWGIGNE